MIIKKLKHIIVEKVFSVCPNKVKVLGRIKEKSIVVYGMRRSGNHVVLNWINYGFPKITHLNNLNIYGNLNLKLLPSQVTFFEASKEISEIGYLKYSRVDYQMNNQICNSEQIICSFEDKHVNLNFLKLYASKTVIILRDPANWLSSFFKLVNDNSDIKIKSYSKKIHTYKSYLKYALEYKSFPTDLIVINFNKFVMDYNYRKEISQRFEGHNFKKSETVLNIVPKNGGGSSFDKLKKNPSTGDRWKYYKEDALFKSLLADKELIALATIFFDSLPGYKEMGLINK